MGYLDVAVDTMDEIPIDRDIQRLTCGTHDEPHALLGAHPTTAGVVVRAWHPEATDCSVCLGEGEVAMAQVCPGLFAATLTATLPLRYRLRFTWCDGTRNEREDPYRFLPSVTDTDVYLFNEGRHRQLWRVLGARVMDVDGCEGVSFAVWAPNAARVSVVGDFNRWDGRVWPMRRLVGSGIFELFVPGIVSGALYKYEILTPAGSVYTKTDPMARALECPPATASRVFHSTYRWQDEAWMAQRRHRDVRDMPMAIYEVHVGSWARVPEEENRCLTYREMAPRLLEHVTSLGFDHIELMPVAEHPFAGSWGYQVSGYYAPSARFGSPDDFRFFVDYFHRHGVGVIVDWVPAHFPKDDFALARFDGTALYEHLDPRQGEHPDWGTLIFNVGRREVCNFLLANALFWLCELHVDGLRVDAVASMLYLDYSREPGAWVPNAHGGRENLAAVAFLRAVNDAVAADAPGCFTVAEESTAWPGVTTSTAEGGLGFTFKWNMGWMHDTLAYFAREPVHRRWHQDQLTFAMLYEHTERFVMPLSHDEVVHGKGSLYQKMPGDPWQKQANIRLLLAYQYTRPGKKLLFMGTELAPYGEWQHDQSLDWHLAEDPARRGLAAFLRRLGSLYHGCSSLGRSDSVPDGFAWIDCNDHENSVLSYMRCYREEHVVVVLNLTPVPRRRYRVGVPAPGSYRVLLSSDALQFGGSGFDVGDVHWTQDVAYHSREQSVVLALPPLGALLLAPVEEHGSST